MSDYFIAVGGTGQLVAMAYHRLVGFMPWQGHAHVYRMDMDMVKGYSELISHSTPVNPLPHNAAETFNAHFNEPDAGGLSKDVLDTLFTSEEQQTNILTGMYGRPPVGASVIMDAINSGGDGMIRLLAELNDGGKHSVVICGSAVGGTGSGGVPTFAQYLDITLKQAGNRDNVKIYVFYFLKHFSLRPKDGASDRDKDIANEQIDRNSRSGMCYMQDRIAKGTDGCLLLGLNDAPARVYQEVGDQREQSQLLYLIAAMYAHGVFAGEHSPFFDKGKHCAHAVDFQFRDGSIIVDDIGLKLPVTERSSVSLDELVQINMEARDLMLRLARIVKGAPRFAFVPALPGVLRQRLKRVPEPGKADTNRELALADAIRRKAEELNAHIKWYGDFTNQEMRGRTRYVMDPVAVGEAAARYRRRPMSFVRNWCRRLGAGDTETAATIDDLTDSLLMALYRTLDARAHNNAFFR